VAATATRAVLSSEDDWMRAVLGLVRSTGDEPEPGSTIEGGGGEGEGGGGEGKGGDGEGGGGEGEGGGGEGGAGGGGVGSCPDAEVGVGGGMEGGGMGGGGEGGGGEGSGGSGAGGGGGDGSGTWRQRQRSRLEHWAVLDP